MADMKQGTNKYRMNSPPCLVMHRALVAAGVALPRLDDDEQLVVGGEEVALGRLQFAAVLGPREPRLRAAGRQALDHRRVAQRHRLALHRFDKSDEEKKEEVFTPL